MKRTTKAVTAFLVLAAMLFSVAFGGNLTSASEVENPSIEETQVIEPAEADPVEEPESVEEEQSAQEEDGLDEDAPEDVDVAEEAAASEESDSEEPVFHTAEGSSFSYNEDTKELKFMEATSIRYEILFFDQDGKTAAKTDTYPEQVSLDRRTGGDVKSITVKKEDTQNAYDKNKYYSFTNLVPQVPIVYRFTEGDVKGSSAAGYDFVGVEIGTMTYEGSGVTIPTATYSFKKSSKPVTYDEKSKTVTINESAKIKVRVQYYESDGTTEESPVPAVYSSLGYRNDSYSATSRTRQSYSDPYMVWDRTAGHTIHLGEDDLKQTKVDGYSLMGVEVEIPDSTADHADALITWKLKKAAPNNTSNTTYTLKKVWDDGGKYTGDKQSFMSNIVLVGPNGEDLSSKRQAVKQDENGNYYVEYFDLEDGVNYVAQENNVPSGYTNTSAPVQKNTTNTTVTITNKPIPNTTNVTITKKWVDDNGSYITAPTDLGNFGEKIKLYDGSTVVNAGNGIVRGTSTNSEGDTIVYYMNLPAPTNGEYIVKEDTGEGYEQQGTATSWTVSNNSSNTTITNKVKPKNVSFTLTKIWEDNSNANKNRPEDADAFLSKITLTGPNGAVTDSPTITKTDGDEWTIVWGNLPEGEYSVTEDQLTGYETGVENTAQKNSTQTTFTNKEQTTKVDVKKVWEDDDNRDGKRTESVTLTLKAGNEKAKDADGNDVTIELSEENGWAGTVENLPKYKNGSEVTYAVDEESVPDGYTLTKDGLIATNVHEIDTLTEVNVTKAWEDEENRDGKRPEEVTVALLADGEPAVDADGKEVEAITLNEENDWTGSFKNLPKNAAGKVGQAIEYTVQELTVAEYTVKVEGDAESGFTVTNSVITEPEKKVNGSAGPVKLATRDEVFTYTVSQVIPENATEATFEDVLEDVLEVVDKPTIDVDGVDPVVEGQTVSAEITDEELLASLAGKTVTLTIKAKIKDGVTDAELVEKYGTAREIPNTADVTINGNTQTTNEVKVVPKNETTGFEVSKTWNDDNNKYNLRPESLTFKVLVNGEDSGRVITLTAADADSENPNLWIKTESGLPTFDEDGNEIVYEVKEVEPKFYGLEDEEEGEPIEKDGVLLYPVAFTNGYKENTFPDEKPEITKYVTTSKTPKTTGTGELAKADEVFTYTVETSIPLNTKTFSVIDKLESVLEPVKGSVTVKVGGEEVKGTDTISGNTITVVLDDYCNRDYVGSDVEVIFQAKVKDGADLSKYKDGIPNEASYTTDNGGGTSNKVKVKVPTKSKTVKTVAKKAAKTGDESNVLLYLAMLSVAAAAFLLAIRRRSRS